MRGVWLAIVFVLVLLALVAAAIVAIDRADLTPVRSHVAGWLSDLTGYPIRVDGALDVDLSRMATVRAGLVCIAGPEWDANADLVCAETFKIIIDLQSILDGPVIIEEVSLGGVALRLKRAPDGTPNWLPRDRDEAQPRAPDRELPVVVRHVALRNLVADVGDPEGDPDSPHIRLVVPNLSQRQDSAGMLHVDATGTADVWPFSVSVAFGPFNALTTGGAIEWRAVADVVDARFEGQGKLPGDGGYEIGLAARGPDADLIGRLVDRPGRLSGPFELRANARTRAGGLVFDARGDTSAADFDIAGSVAEVASLEGLDVSGRANGSNLDKLGEVLGVKLPTGSFDVQVEAHRNAQRNELRLVGSVGVHRFDVDGAFARPDTWAGARIDMKLEGSQLDRLDARLPAGAYEAAARLTPEDTGLRFDDARVAIAGITATGNGRYGWDERFEAHFEGAGSNLAVLSEVAGVELPREAFKVRARLGGSDSSITIKDGRFEGATATASIGGVFDWRAQSGEFRVDANATDANRLLPKESELRPGPVPMSAKGTLRWRKARLELDDVQLQGPRASVQVSGMIDPGAGTGEIRLDARAEDASRLLPASASFRPSAIPLSATGAVRWRKARIEFDDVQVRAASALARVSGALEEGVATPVAVTVEVPDLAALGVLDGEPLPDVALVGRARVALEDGTIVLNDLDARIDDSPVSGTIRFRPATEARRPHVEATLEAEHLDIGTWLDEPKRKPPADGRVLDDEPLPFDALRSVDGHVRFAVGRLTTDTFGVVRTEGEIRLDAGRLEMDAKATGSQGGTVAVGLDIEPAAGGPAIRLEVDSQRLRLPILSAPDQDPATLPQSDLRATFKGRGSTARQIAAGLDGTVRLSSGAGDINRYRLELLLGDIVTELVRVLNPWRPPEESAQQECATYLVRIEDGVITGVPGLVLRTDTITVFAQGTIDLGSEKIDLRFESRPRARLSVSASEVLTPFTKLGGTLARPRLVVDAPSSVVSGGLAVVTGGLSLLIKPVLDRLTRSESPCADAVKFFESETGVR